MEKLRKLQGFFNSTSCGTNLVIYVLSVYKGRYFVDAASSFKTPSKEKCGFSLDNLVRIQIIQIVVNNLGSVPK